MTPQPTVLDEILFQLERTDLFNKHKELTMLDMPSVEILNRARIDPNIKCNQFISMIRSGSMDVEIGTSFSVIIPRKNISEYCKCKLSLKYVSVNPSYEVSYLPRGYSGLGLFEFPDGIPNILEKLPYYNEKRTSNHDMLILTQEPVLDAILQHKLYIDSCSGTKE